MNRVYAGDTFSRSAVFTIITDHTIDDDRCQLRFDYHTLTRFGQQLLIGEVTQAKTIIDVHILFYDQYDHVIVGNDAYQIQSVSLHHHLGHLLNIFHRTSRFSYAIAYLSLQPDSMFHLHNLFFHFSHPPSSSSSEEVGDDEESE